jgi:hypothetical protein
MTKQLFCMTAVAALAAASQVVRADVYAFNDVADSAYSEAEAQPMTCEQATAYAWFKRQMELSDGDTDPTVQVPTECGRTYVAQSPDRGDDGEK